MTKQVQKSIYRIMELGGKEYKTTEDGTHYPATAPDELILVLEDARINGRRIRLFYGDDETGIDFLEEYDIIGRIGRTGGIVKSPILLKRENSSGGPLISADIVLKVTDAKTKKVLYQHPMYQEPYFVIRKNESKKMYDLIYNGQTHAVFPFGEEQRMENYIKFMKGERNRI